jgi:hypothetical protein
MLKFLFEPQFGKSNAREFIETSLKHGVRIAGHNLALYWSRWK